MRGKRAKKYRKLMHQYEVNFNFREPYQVLLDSAILQETWQKKIDLVGRLSGVLGGEIKPMVTQCDMRHLYGAQPKDEQLILQAKTYERRRCGHHELEKPLSSLECLSSCVDPKGTLTNKHRYVVATQDPKIRAAMRRIPGVPLIYISKSVMILEPMASATEDVREREERAKFKAGLKGRRGGPDAGEKRKRDNDDEGTRDQEGPSEQPGGDARPQKKKRVKGPKGPNPLSIKKPKKSKDQPPQKGELAKPKPAKTDQPQHDGDDTAVHSGGEGGEPGKRKRKRKHKPKGDGGVSLVGEPETTAS